MISIRQIFEDDWGVLRQIRLRALESDPYVFGATLAHEIEKTESSWRELLQNPDTAVFILYNDNSAIGLTGITADRNDSTKQTAYLWGSWIHPDYRGRHLSNELYAARINWARQHETFKRIIVSHRDSNLASKHANQKHNFVYTHSKDKVWNDNISEKEHIYELIL